MSGVTIFNATVLEVHFFSEPMFSNKFIKFVYYLLDQISSFQANGQWAKFGGFRCCDGQFLRKSRIFRSMRIEESNQNIDTLEPCGTRQL